jgi:hypothetical protein
MRPYALAMPRTCVILALHKIASVNLAFRNENEEEPLVQIIMTLSIYVKTCFIPRPATLREPKINFLGDLDAARKTQTGLANCDGSLFSLRRNGKRKTLGQSDILSSELKVYPATCLADFITKCDRTSRSHASTNVGVQTSRYLAIPTSDIRTLGVDRPLLSTAAIAVVPQNQTFRRRLPQTNGLLCPGTQPTNPDHWIQSAQIGLTLILQSLRIY